VSLAVIHDPRARLAGDEALRRVALGCTDGALRRAGPLVVAASGAGRTPLVGLDGDPPALGGEYESWLGSLRAARGAFAVAAWDGQRGLLARDHLGACPLFHATHDGVLYAASEVAAVLRMLPTRPPPDEQALGRWLAGEVPAGGITLFTGVRALPPAHALVLEGTARRQERYWTPGPRAGLADATADEAAGLLRDAIRAGVRTHAADAGVLLSGGLDSSAVLACVAAEAQAAAVAPPAAFSVAFPHRRELDETAAGRAVAARWGAPWYGLAAARGSVMPYLNAHLDRFELPLESPNGAFFRPALAAAADAGVSVLLDGEGGDELFGCEPLLIADRLGRGDVRGAWRLAHALPGTDGRIGRRAGRVIARQWVLPGLLPPRAVEALRYVRHPRAQRSRAADPGWWRRDGPRWRAHLAWTLTDWRADLAVQDRLRRIAALAGIRDGHPLLDVDLIELVLGLPPELAFDAHHDRPLLRRAMRGWLPERVRLRGDKVFFTALVLDALLGPDRANVERVLSGSRLELAPLVAPSRARDLWAKGPGGHTGGRWAWGLEVWRLLAAETWLRREAG
jgi:asparagine synthase (glutamine-hydrolysing)